MRQTKKQMNLLCYIGNSNIVIVCMYYVCCRKIRKQLCIVYKSVLYLYQKFIQDAKFLQ